MLRILFVSLIPLVALSAEARIVEVHLMPGGAEVTAEVAVSDGAAVLDDLPADLDVGSVRVAPGDGVTVRSIDLRTRYGEDAEGRRAGLEAELDEVEDALALLDRAAADREIARGMLGRVGSGDQGVPDVSEAFGAVSDALYRLAQQENEDRARRRELTSRREALRAELQALGSAATARTTLHVATAGNGGKLRVRYPVTEARFEVRYRLRFDSAQRRVTLEPRLMVAQNTGTDWRDVRLSAATTRRSYRLDVPEPDVPVLRPRAPEPVMRRETSAMADMMLAGAAPRPKAQAVATANRYDIRYELPSAVDIPADNRERPFVLPSITLDGEMHARIVPQREAAAYLQVRWRMPGDAAIAAGTAEVLRDDVIVGTTRLPMLLPGQTHDQGFGIDPALEVTVERDPARRDESFFGNRQRWLQAQTVRVESAHEEPVTVRIVETVPVAGDGDIDVAIEGDAPTTRDLDGRKGLHEWRAELAPGAVRRWDLRYTVSAPSDMDLGL